MDFIFMMIVFSFHKAGVERFQGMLKDQLIVKYR